MASLLTPSGVISSGSSGGIGASNKRKSEFANGVATESGGTGGGSKKKRALTGFQTDDGLYPGCIPEAILVHKKEAYPTNSANSTTPKFSIRSGHNELIR
jgi:hypothetical protein